MEGTIWLWKIGKNFSWQSCFVNTFEAIRLNSNKNQEEKTKHFSSDVRLQMVLLFLWQLKTSRINSFSCYVMPVSHGIHCDYKYLIVFLLSQKSSVSIIQIICSFYIYCVILLHVGWDYIFGRMFFRLTTSCKVCRNLCVGLGNLTTTNISDHDCNRISIQFN